MKNIRNGRNTTLHGSEWTRNVFPKPFGAWGHHPWSQHVRVFDLTAWVNLKGSDLASKSEYFACCGTTTADESRRRFGESEWNACGTAVRRAGAHPFSFHRHSRGDVPVVVENDGRASEPVFVRSTGVLPAIIGVPEPNADNPRLFASATTAAQAGLIAGHSKRMDSRQARSGLASRSRRFPWQEIDLFAIGLGGLKVSSRPIGSSPAISRWRAF